jgi:hypothetical protein
MNGPAGCPHARFRYLQRNDRSYHRLCCEVGIVAIHYIGETLKFLDSEPPDLGVFIANVAWFTTFPTDHLENMMQRLPVEFRLALFDALHPTEVRWRHPNFFLNLANKCCFQCLSGFNPTADRVPMSWPCALPVGTKSHQDLSVLVDQQCTDRNCEILHR